MRTTLAVGLAFVLSACRGGAQHLATDTTPTTTTTSSASPATTAQAEQLPLRVLSADVDGNGRLDRLSYRWVKRTAHTPFRGSVLVTVRFGRGGIGRIVVPIDHWMDRAHPERPSLPDSAAAQLDGVPGSEIVVDVDDTPASFSAYRVVTFHDGHLTLLPAPPHHPWFVGAAASAGGSTFDCRNNVLTAVDLVPLAHPRISTRGIFRIIRTSYRWTRGGWKQVRRTVRRNPGVGGWWFCPQLSKWRG